MPAYYNEIDKFAQEWLRQLMQKGLIADGEIDGRDIRDVRPTELTGFTQCHFFAGIERGIPRARSGNAGGIEV